MDLTSASNLSKKQGIVQVVQTLEEMRTIRHSWTEGKVAFVPTMGALHEGHMALFEHAKQLADKVVVSIFVNPLQFAPTEDYKDYPRALEQDIAMCEKVGVDVLFTPQKKTLFPDLYDYDNDSLTWVVPPKSLTDRLCGNERPGHFAGVATIVLKLFQLVQPHISIFGKKDVQQLAIIRKMVSDLSIPTEIIAHPIIREASGLARSSRNQYLNTETAREASLILSKLLHRLQGTLLLDFNERSADFLSITLFRQLVETSLQMELEKLPSAVRQAFRLEYLEWVDENSLVSVFDDFKKMGTSNTLLMGAAKIETPHRTVRLIDTLAMQDET